MNRLFIYLPAYYLPSRYRYTFLLLLILLPLSSFFLVSAEESRPGQLPDLTAAEILWLREHQTLRVAGPKAFPPFQYVREDGTVGGMASDYIHLLSERLGIQMDIHTGLTWPQVLQEAKERTLDVISCAARTAERETYLTFTTPYLSFPMVIISRKDTPFISGLDDLNGKKVAVIRQVSTYEWLQRDHIDTIPHFVDSLLEALESVAVGFADAHVINLAAASYLIEKHGLTNLKVAAPTRYGNYDLSFAVRGDWPELVTILDKALASITQEEHNAIRQKWIAVRYEHRFDSAYFRKIVLQVGAVFAVILTLIFFWNRHIRLSEERFRGLTEHGTDLILTFKQDGEIIYQSPSNTTILGYQPKELLNTNIFELIHEADRPALEEILATVLHKEHLQTFEHRIRHKQGHYLYIESNYINLLDNNAVKAIVINARDITQRKESRKELQRAKEAAESANVAKSTFLANMSHEFRTPLNAILGFARLMARNPKLDQEQQEELAIIHHSGEHLLTLINDVLDMSKIEAGRITSHERDFDLYQLLDGLEETFKLRAQEKSLQLIVEYESNVPQYIRTDEIKLRQVLINLLSNAIKFTDEGGVAVRIKNGHLNNENREGEENNHQASIVNLQFEIKDTGAGIASDEIEHLFTPFTQTRTGKSSSEGTGLGLSISQRFAQLMGGKLIVHSEVDHGSVFGFNIRATIAEKPEIQKRLSERRIIALEPNQPQYRILIVDDKQESRQLLVKLLQPLGFKLQEAANGQEAFITWQRWQPHLIWMDMRMPSMDGYEATKQIRNAESGMRTEQHSAFHTTIIALTASSLKEDRKIMVKAGCDDYLTRPFREADFFNVLHKHLGVRYIHEKREGRTQSGETPNSQAPTLRPADLSDLPPELLENLEHATITTDISEMLKLIEQVRLYNFRLAENLTMLTMNFEYATILHNIQGIKHLSKYE